MFSTEFKNRDFTVAIVGGGMCGLTCAVPLHKAGIKVDVFEAAQRFGEIGAAVSIGPNCVRALDALGLLGPVIETSKEPELSFRAFRFISGYGQHDELHDYASASKVENGMGVYRPSFVKVMSDLMGPSVAHFNKRCESVETTPDRSAHVLHFTDGTSYEADLVIGADGIKSVVRDAVVGGDGFKHMVFGNTVAYRGMIPADVLKEAGVRTVMDDRPLCWMGTDHHIITFPFKSNSMINIVVFASRSDIPVGSIEIPPSQWSISVPETEMFEEFKDWGPDVQIILRHLQKPLKWSIHMIEPPLGHYVRDHIALVGDAAHGMLPHLGAGFGQGCEDALLLTRLLTHSHCNKSTLKQVLEVYDTIRRPRANFVLNASLNTGRIYDGYSPGTSSVTEVQNKLTDIWTPVWFHDLDADFSEAKQMLDWP